MPEAITSVGIDIGTSTTQLVFSRLTIDNIAGRTAIPQFRIVDKQVIYRSAIHFTPLTSSEDIDAERLAEIVRAEYRAAGFQPLQVSTGAIIITGLTARMSGAQTALEALSDLAGEFVVATAGPALESVLAARGAGADVLSANHRCVLANLDCGGGTTNIALFNSGALVGTTCLDIGGRLLKVDHGRVVSIHPKAQQLAAEAGIMLSRGVLADIPTLSAVAALMASNLAQALHLAPTTGQHLDLYTHPAVPLPDQPTPTALTVSGGVADAAGQADIFRFGDIGTLLGNAIASDTRLARLVRYQPAETIRATVVGAGTHSTELSGSTVCFRADLLPLKNIPVLRLGAVEEAEPSRIQVAIRAGIELFAVDGSPGPMAVSLSGSHATSFAEVQGLAAAIAAGSAPILAGPHPLIVVLEQDIAKALGHALAAVTGRRDIICLDRIHAHNGEYLDIGAPVGAAGALPVVIKTLVFAT